jgi:hypothetical protein
MTRWIFTSLIFAFSHGLASGQKIVSAGIFTGLTAPFTLDEGISNDPRYQYRYLVKFVPIGFNFEIDYNGYGLIASPSYLKYGQNFNVLNSVGGQMGIRRISMEYIDVPIGFKLHVIDLSFFKVSFVASAGIQYLIKGEETISHDAGKMRFPLEVYPILPSEYVPQYDGVLVPQVKNYQMLSSADFNKTQITGALGFRSDWEITQALKVSFDLRANYCFFEPRTQEYLTKVENHETLYDISGQRKEVFVFFSIGASRIFDLENSKKSKGKRRGDKAYKFKSKRKPPKF